MKVHIAMPDVTAVAIDRVAQALQRYAPADIEFVTDRRTASVVVMIVVGRRDQVADAADMCRLRGQKYAIVQLVLRSTQKAHTRDWIDLWNEALVTWSYLDLQAMCRADGVDSFFSFYYAPLGVDEAFRRFVPRDRRRQRYVMLTSGRDWLNESVRECVMAARAVNRETVHLGAEVGHHVACRFGLTDDEVAALYRQSEYVSGLRRTEGFELPMSEGLLCGARPVTFDAEHYRHWFEPWATFIREGTRDEVVAQLTELFAEPAPPVSREEHNAAADRFLWPRLVKTWWEAVR